MFSVGTPPIEHVGGADDVGHDRRRRRPRRSGRSRGRAATTPRTTRSRRACSAVGANACASPVQPSRSSRCGQSVGTETKLSRCDQKTFEWNRSSAACDERNVRARGEVARDRDRGRPTRPRRPSTSAYRKPWNVKTGSSVVLAVAVERCRRRSPWRCAAPRCAGRRRARAPRRGAPSTVSPARPRTTRRTQPAMFWPASRRRSPSRGSDVDVGQLGDRAHGGAMRGSNGRGSTSSSRTPRSSRVVEAGGVPARGLAAADRSSVPS